ncbi:MAG: hypothetical protein ACOC9Y_06475 [Chloroflexota bacterium]
MNRQLPVPRQENGGLIPRSMPSRSSLSQFALALAPDILRVAERLASNRSQNRAIQKELPVQRDSVQGIHLSEVEIDMSVPFVRKITMRNATAWSRSPYLSALPPPPSPKRGRLRRIGILGASSALAIVAGIVTRRVGPLAQRKDQIIDVPGGRRE